ncbi:hypothetical protein CSB93_0310 [Pseudomonas paraeruginosa]|uniref:Uncharacterized protein n=1 Tax=Pseudomonas paraeruginosa TaxID=2994495 RepID=A0A2R3IXG8_9PSED|nr:hypothetical protein CSB93_0310 [Pseudomonas paraeruginosa]
MLPSASASMAGLVKKTSRKSSLTGRAGVKKRDDTVKSHPAFFRFMLRCF